LVIYKDCMKGDINKCGCIQIVYCCVLVFRKIYIQLDSCNLGYVGLRPFHITTTHLTISLSQQILTMFGVSGIFTKNILTPFTDNCKLIRKIK